MQMKVRSLTGRGHARTVVWKTKKRVTLWRAIFVRPLTGCEGSGVAMPRPSLPGLLKLHRANSPDNASHSVFTDGMEMFGHTLNS